MLINRNNREEETFYFFDDDIPLEISNNFANHYHLYTPNSNIGKIFFVLKLRILRRLLFPFLYKSEIYGQDNLLITSPLIGKKKMFGLEDGLLNYTYKPILIKYAKIRKILGGALLAQNPYGYSDCVSKLYLTGISDIPEQIKSKVVLVELERMWNDCDVNQKTTILAKFNLTDSIIKEFQNIDSILLTQPLSEDKALSEEEKVKLYSGIIKNAKIAIKPHPRELTNYKKIFPNAIVLKPYLPIELITLIGVKFSDVYTVFSTAALGMPGNPRIHFFGTKVHPALVKKWGDVRFEDGRLITI